MFYAYSAVFIDLMQNFLKVGLVTIKSESSAPKAYCLLSPVKKSKTKGNFEGHSSYTNRWKEKLKKGY